MRLGISRHVSSRLKGRTAVFLALGVGSAPGVALPLLVANHLDVADSDLFLLSISVTVLLQTLFASIVEATAVGRVSAHLHRHGNPTCVSLKNEAGYVSTRLGPVSFIAFPVIGAVYLFLGSLHGASVGRILPLIPLAAVAVFTLSGSVWSGYLTARGRLSSIYFWTILRGGPTLVVALVYANPFALSLTYAVGECIRASVLRMIAVRDAQRHESAESCPLDRFKMRDFNLQLVAIGLLQLVPIVGRVALSSGPAGSVTSGEIANRVFQSANQLSTSGFVLPVVPRIPSLLDSDERHVRRISIGREIFRLGCVTGALAAVGAISVCVLELVVGAYVNTHVTRGLWWSLTLLLGLPASAVNVWGARAMIIMNKASWFPVMAVAGVLGGGFAIFAGWSIFGPFGVMLGLTVGQIVPGLIAGAVVLLEAREFRVGSWRDALQRFVD